MITRTKPVVVVEAQKGGIGKSTLARIALGWHIRENENPILLDTDPKNPDVAVIYAEDINNVAETHKGRGCDIHLINMVEGDKDDRSMARATFTDIIAENPDRPIIVNTPARNSAVADLGRLYEQIDPEQLITLFLVDDDEQAAVLLDVFLNEMPYGKICIVKNEKFGKISDYENFFGKTQIGKIFAESHAVASLKEIHKDIMNKVKNDFVGFNEIADTLTFGQKLMLNYDEGFKAYNAAIANAKPVADIIARRNSTE